MEDAALAVVEASRRAEGALATRAAALAAATAEHERKQAEARSPVSRSGCAGRGGGRRIGRRCRC
jgi:hypothetical protein